MTNQHRKGHARAQIIADAVHCRGCQRFWDSGRVVGLTLPLPDHGRFAVIREQSQNAVEVRRGEARLWVRCPVFASARQLQQALEVSRRNRLRLHPIEVVTRQIGENMLGRRLEKKLASQFQGDAGCFVPADSVRDVVGQVFRDTSGCPHSARSRIADVNAFRIGTMPTRAMPGLLALSA